MSTGSSETPQASDQPTEAKRPTGENEPVEKDEAFRDATLEADTQDDDVCTDNQQVPGTVVKSRRIPRRVVVIGVVVLAVIALAIGVTSLVINIQKENEARAEAVSLYESSYSGYESSVAELKATIESAGEVADDTDIDDVSDPAALTKLTDSIVAAQQKIAGAGERAKLDLDNNSTEELLGEVDRVDVTSSGIDSVKATLVTAVDQLGESKSAKRQADERASKKAAAQAVGYEDLFRAGDSVIGTYYKFEAKVIQDAGSGSYRVNMTQKPGYSRIFWEDTILITVAGATSQRLLEDDIISFVAVSAGLQRYTTIFGATVELPMVLADGNDISVTGRDD